MSRISIVPNMDWRTMLDKSYHHLCRSVRPEAFFSWLRSKGVLSLSDQEEVEGKYTTTVMKTGHLIDIIKTKGEKGYKAFMEVVEYVYPDTYHILTGLQPGVPPKDFEPNAGIDGRVVREKRSPALSAEILGQMGDLVNVLVQANAVKKEELTELQNYVKQLQEENQTMCEENRSTLQKFKDAQTEIEQLNLKLNDLSLKHDHDIKERKSLIAEQDRLCKLKDNYVQENQKLRQERDDLDCRFQLKEVEMKRSQTCRGPGPSHDRERNDKLQQENKKAVDLVKDSLDMKVKEWQSKHTTLQERYDHVIADLEEVKQDRNQMSHQLEDLQSIYDKERQENQRLVADSAKYQDRFCVMESQIEALKQEIDHLSQQSPATRPLSTANGANGDIPYERSVSESGSLDSSKFPRSLKVIDQTPGKCPSLKRQVVINKPERENSFSSI